ncbi:heptaprenyl diphosphate synthase component I [Peptoniphilus sp. ING2-D1G]|nr:heptaprenyl diphosphate synthase component I [Peptoniphilus sp. ING2-D1G]
MSLRKLIYLSLLTSGGLILGLLELNIPMPIVIPGAKIGISNIIVLVTIVFFGYGEGIFVAVLKTFLLVLLTGSVSSFIFSFTGTMLSAFVMILAHRFLSRHLSIIGISILGAVFHNVGQILAAVMVLESANIIAYLPFLMIFAIFTGIFIGFSSREVVKILTEIYKERK